MDEYNENITNNNEESTKQKKWPLFLIIGGVVIMVTVIAVIMLFIVLVVLALLFGKMLPDQANNTITTTNTVTTSYSANNNGMPPTVQTAVNAPYDYTFINEAYGKDTQDLQNWINKYYTGSIVSKNDYGHGIEVWTIKSSSMNPISIGGYTYKYEYVKVSVNKGLSEKFSFVNNGSDTNNYDQYYKDLSAIYGPVKLYRGKNDILTQITDPEQDYSSYTWFDSDFDGFYNLWLIRFHNQSDPYIEIQIDRNIK